jgi:hypothetical protein
VLEVFGQVDGRHPALTEAALDPVAICEGSREPGGDVGHGAKIGLTLPIRES